MSKEVFVNGKPLDPDSFDFDETEYETQRTRELQAHRRRRGHSGETGPQSNFGRVGGVPRHFKYRAEYD